MEADFWHDRWEKGQLGFHQPVVNGRLQTHLSQVASGPDQRIFLPLCGKTLDMTWLLSEGFQVCGVELSKLAIQQYFEEQKVEPIVTRAGAFDLYQAPNLDLFVGDFFDLTSETLGPVDAIYDRAALVALPEDMRQKYATKLMEVTGNAPQLLLTFNYDQTLLQGPPFSITSEMIEDYYSKDYEISLLESFTLPNGLRPTVPAVEQAWYLRPNLA
ncbi:thiopurine S-methyltransferase [Sneathiella limimaris]|uniref:thiopurine S-methyltransferase n=1 Tax=Sneathiella limimaris TaxID=1964213 RepID=UPI00146A09B1|nr:thiopurine S-methyltransferase [Sneathiella limimaris]